MQSSNCLVVEVQRPLLELGWYAAAAVAPPAARIPAELGGVAGRPVGVADRPPLQRGRQCPAGAELPVVARHELFPRSERPAAAVAAAVAAGEDGPVQAAAQVVAGGGEGLGAFGCPVERQVK